VSYQKRCPCNIRSAFCYLWNLRAKPLAQAPVGAHDPTGQWASLSTDMREWFKSLRSGSHGTPCCEEADGEHVADVDWDTHRDGAGDTHYRVYLLGAWREVPEGAIITKPNRYGFAVVWPVYSRGVNGQKEFGFIRCFLPGAGT
jgi:hypothetical protein